MVAISMPYVTIPFIHLTVLERREREWKREEWISMLIDISLNELNG